MAGVGELFYRILQWDESLLQAAGKMPAGPLYSIQCLEAAVCQLHLPHCATKPALLSEGLSVVHITGDGMSILKPLDITSTHVVVDVPHLSAFGLVIEVIKRLLNIQNPISGQILLFHRPVFAGKSRKVNVFLLPENIPLQEVRSQQENAEVQPLCAPFDFKYGPNYHPTFELRLTLGAEEATVTVRDQDERPVWEYHVELSASSSSPAPEPVSLPVQTEEGGSSELSTQPPANEPTSLSVPAEEGGPDQSSQNLPRTQGEDERKLFSVRTEFIDRISTSVLNDVLDKLLQSRVINNGEMESVQALPRAEKSRNLIDMVLKKGNPACKVLIKTLCDLDPGRRSVARYAVMKRVRTEQIQYAVAQYLKRRQYVDTDGSLKGARLFQSAEEMAASLTVQTESSCANMVSAAPCQSDPQQYETQYSRLRSFLSESDISWAKEVSSILYPLFVYLYLDMVRCGLKGAVDGFYSRFHGAFLQDSEQRSIVELLRHVLTAQDVATNSKLSAFLQHKYVVHLTEPAYSYLLRYLQSEDNSAICRALSTHLLVEVSASRRTDYQLYGAAAGTTTAPNSTSSWAGVDGAEGGDGVEVPAGIPQSEAALETLQDCIKKVSADSRLLAGGFDSSTVKLWSLRARKLKARPHQADVSRIHLACDVLEEDVDEEDGCGNSSLVASSSMDNSVRVWDIRNSHSGTSADGSSSELVGLYTGNTSNVLNVQFMACNLLLVTGTAQEKAEQ
ncbi:hypothetical protein Q5P01_025694 [Channa striata]|uniref:Uncharacterized protein n=1 Tax=Channa striata TaxID=64152 RepID=A0AA88IXB5_CHASR|nr:hypothetical protein Q5P01_025694 [Channa striata]